MNFNHKILDFNKILNLFNINKYNINLFILDLFIQTSH